MFTVDFTPEDGEVVFTSDSTFENAVQEIYGLLSNSNIDTEVTEVEGGLSISFPLFIEFFDSIIDIIRHINDDVKLTDEAKQIIGFTRNLLDTPDTIREELTIEEVQGRLDREGWNSNDKTGRPLSTFQMRNLISTSKRDNAAIFSVPGAGKTVESLAFSTVVAGGDALFVIVCPRNAYGSWEHELAASLNIKPDEIIRAIGNDDELRGKILAKKKPYRAVLVNYNRLWFRYRVFSEYIQRMIENERKVVTIFDESHHFKGGKSFTSAVKRIAPFASHRVILSGTPMPKSASDLVNQFQSLLPHLVNEINDESVMEFTQGRFVRTTKGDQGLKEVIITFKEFEMDEMQSEIHTLLRDWAVAEAKAKNNKRLKAQIIKLQRVIIFAVMVASNPVLVREKFSELLNLVDSGLAKKLEACKNNIPSYGPKFNYAIKRARELAAEGKKVLIWSSFVDNVALIAEELEDLNAVYLRGDVPTDDGKDDPYARYADVSDSEEETREARINKFKTDDSCRVMVANPAAAGEGISLHDVCHHAIYLDRTFHATQFMQSMDRIHRYGIDEDGDIICAKHDTNIEILTCKNSIDQMIHTNLRRKMEAMYNWLNDRNLNPQLGILEPLVSNEEIEQW
jgi:SNF2 family DNA or RNA helicase